MKSSAYPIVTAMLLVLLLAAPAVAERYTVTLDNGTEFVTLRQPRVASWDPGVVLVITEAGNWIGLPEASISSVIARSEALRLGRVIDSKTIEIGFSANDAPTEEELAEQEASRDPYLRALERLESLAQPPEQPNTTVEQFVNPEDTVPLPTSYGNSGLAQEYYGTGYDPEE